DRVFFWSGWSPPHTEGAITVRVSRGDRAVVHLPLPVVRAYDVVLRLDPVAPGVQDRAAVLFNRLYVARLRLRWDPTRVGSYRLRLPANRVKQGINELVIIPESVVTARSAGSRFDWLDPADPIGIRFWYARVLQDPLPHR